MGRQWWRRPRRPIRGSPAPASGPTAQLPVGPGESRSPLPAFQPPAGLPPAGGVVFYSGRPSGRVPSGLCRWCRPAAAFARVVAGRAAARRMAARRRAGCGAVKALREWRGWPMPALRPVRPRRRPLPRGFAATGALPRPCFFGNMLQTVLPLLQIGQRTKKNRKYSGCGALSYAKIYYLCGY